MNGWNEFLGDPGPLILLTGVALCAALILQALVRGLIRSWMTWQACRRAAERLGAGAGGPPGPPGALGDALSMLREASGRATGVGVPVEGAGAFNLLYSLVEAGDAAVRDLNRQIAGREERRGAAAYLEALSDPAKPAVGAGPDAGQVLEVFAALDLDDRPKRSSG